MSRGIRVQMRRVLTCLIASYSMTMVLFGMIAHAETTEYQTGACIQVETGLEGRFSVMDFTCMDTDYQGGYLFVANDVIPYTLSSRYGTSDNNYTVSDARIWLNQYFADTLSVADEILPVKLEETDDFVSDRVFCLSINEVKKPSYKKIARKAWTSQPGMRYYWTRSKRENTTNQAYLVQYNGHVASSRVSLSESGIRPAFVLARAKENVSQGRIWYEGDTQEQLIHGISYTFRCIDPNYRDAGGNRAGALFLCDTIIGGDKSIFDETHNSWEVSDLRSWLNTGGVETEGMGNAVTTIGFTYVGKSSNYQLDERNFTKRKQPGVKVQDQVFCLSLEEAIRYSDRLWKLGDSDSDNFIQAGSHTMGYWLRTPAARDGKYCYAVTYDGRVTPEEAKNDRIGIRPAFVAVQE